MRHVSAIQNSASSQTSPGFVSSVRATLSPSRRAELAQHRLAEADPRAGVRLLAHQVVALGPEPHRQHVVGPLRRLAPDRRERDVAADLSLVLEHLDPRAAVGVRPHRVVDAREVDLDARSSARAGGAAGGSSSRSARAATRAGTAARSSAAPGGGVLARLGHELVPGVGVDAARRADAARSARASSISARATCQPPRLPLAVLRHRWLEKLRAGAPRSRRRASRTVSAGTRHSSRHELGRELRVVARRAARGSARTCRGPARIARGEVLLPVHPARARSRGRSRRARAARARRRAGAPPRVPGQGEIHRSACVRGVREARVDHRDARARRSLRVDDALRVRVEVVPRLEVRREQQHELRAASSRATAGRRRTTARSPGAPRRCTRSCGCCARRRPRPQQARHEVIVARPPDVVHDLVVAALVERLADAAADVVERLVPAHLLELARAARARRA